jgi:cbb3-type cytochrome oxidase subunit 3
VNPVLELAAESVTLGWLLGFMTVFFMVSFLAWVWWAYTPRHKAKMEEAALLPFADGEET